MIFFRYSLASLNFNREMKIWSIYFLTIFLSIFLHELCHCIPAWIGGIRAIPTPSKEYLLDSIPESLMEYVSLGGIIGTVLFSLVGIAFYLNKNTKYNSAILAGAIANPGIYALRFLIVGRGHDATEFQEAQSALGLNYSGHSLDWLFVTLLIIGVIAWIAKSKPSYKILGRLFIGLILTIIFIIGLQVVNNAIFDPIFNT